MYVAALGAGAVAALALAVRVLQSTHRRPGTGTGHARHPLRRVVLGVLTLLVRTSLRLGIRLGPMMMLTVPGRRSGLPRTNPVDLWTGEGRSFLVATHTEYAAWVANLRAARGGTLWRGRRRWAFTAIELPREDAAVVLKNVLGPRLRRPIAGFVLRRTLAVSPDAPIGAFVDAAKTHPVFELTLTPIDTSGSGPRSKRRQRDGVNPPATPRRSISGILMPPASSKRSTTARSDRSRRSGRVLLRHRNSG